MPFAEKRSSKILYEELLKT